MKYNVEFKILSRSENLLFAMFLRTSVLQSLGRLTAVQFPWLRPTVILINASEKHRPSLYFPMNLSSKGTRSQPIRFNSFKTPFFFFLYSASTPNLLSIKKSQISKLDILSLIPHSLSHPKECGTYRQN